MPPQDLHGNTLVELMEIPAFAAHVRGAIVSRAMRRAAYLLAPAAAAVLAAAAAPLPPYPVALLGPHTAERDTGYAQAMALRNTGTR